MEEAAEVLYCKVDALPFKYLAFPLEVIIVEMGCGNQLSMS